MNIEWMIGSVKLQVIINRHQKVRGICSTLKDGLHIIMWDFDNVPFGEVNEALSAVAAAYELPPIHVVRTSDELHWHAYCFDRAEFVDALHVVMQTRHVDPGFYKLAVLRGYFTLRISPKETDDSYHHAFKHGMTLKGYRNPTVDPNECVNMVTYWTKRR